MKAIEKNDSSNMSAQDQAPINLHTRRSTDGEIQSEDVQEERARASLCRESVFTTLHTSFSSSSRMYTVPEHRRHNLKQRVSTSVTTGHTAARL